MPVTSITLRVYRNEKDVEKDRPMIVKIRRDDKKVSIVFPTRHPLRGLVSDIGDVESPEGLFSINVKVPVSGKFSPEKFSEQVQHKVAWYLEEILNLPKSEAEKFFTHKITRTGSINVEVSIPPDILKKHPALWSFILKNHDSAVFRPYGFRKILDINYLDKIGNKKAVNTMIATLKATGMEFDERLSSFVKRLVKEGYPYEDIRERLLRVYDLLSVVEKVGKKEPLRELARYHRKETVPRILKDVAKKYGIRYKNIEPIDLVIDAIKKEQTKHTLPSRDNPHR